MSIVILPVYASEFKYYQKKGLAEFFNTIAPFRSLTALGPRRDRSPLTRQRRWKTSLLPHYRLKSGRTRSDEFLKDASEVAWILKPDLKPDFRNTATRRCRQFPFNAFYSLREHVSVRRVTRTLFEQFRKVVRTHVDDVGKLLKAQILGQVVANEIKHSFHPISG